MLEINSFRLNFCLHTVAGTVPYNNYNNYSFKIFLRFWLDKIPPIIHHHQLLSTEFGRKLMTSIVQQNCLGIERLTEKTWGRGWVVLVVNTKMAEHFTRFTNCWLKTKQKQWCDDLTDDFCCLENLQNWTFRYLLNLLINMRYRRWRWWGGGGGWHLWLVFKLEISLNE